MSIRPKNWLRRQTLFTTHRASAPPASPRRRTIGGILLTALKRTCMTIGAMILISALIGMFTLSRVEDNPDSIPGNMVLYFKLDGGIVEKPRGGFAFSDEGTPIRDLVDALDIAAHDDRVKGLVAEFSGGMFDLSHLSELRDAVVRFQKSGKFAKIYAEDFSGGMGSYYLASAFGEIWMQPMGMLSLPGIHAEMPYARAMMDKIGVQPAFFARKEYKNLFEGLERNDMSPATHESTAAMVDDIAATLVSAIAAGRKKTEAQVKAGVDMGLMTDLEAQKYGFVDKLGYRDDLLEGLRVKLVGDRDAEEELPFYYLSEYARLLRKDHNDHARTKHYPEIALVYAVGSIGSGSERSQATYGGGEDIAADDLSADIREAAREKAIKVIVIRVNSPGGSPSASETIRRAVVYAKGRGKKVYVSMGGAAASGGYWISAAADRIYASPLTMTGSIGVTGGKFVLTELWNKVGVSWDGVSYGKNADIWSFNEAYTPAGEERMNTMFDRIYDGFVDRVAEGRGMSRAEADKVARGRVWTGHQALQVKLVDRLGGLDRVLDDVAVELKQKNRFHLRITVLPKPETTLERFMKLIGSQARLGMDLQSAAGMLNGLQPLAETLNLDPERTVYEPLRVR